MVVNGVPEIVYESMSNALVKAGYFPHDPKDPFLLEVVHSASPEDAKETEMSPLTRLALVAAVQGALNAAQHAAAPCVCCTVQQQHVYVALAHGATWSQVDDAMATPPLLVLSYVDSHQ